MGTLIVGASVAGVRTVQALRMLGYTEPITMLGEERHHPYDKPPLSKDTLADGGLPVPLLSDEELEALRVDLRLGVRASALDMAERRVVSETGETFRYDDLVIATGVRPRTLPGADQLGGVHTLRTADDAVAVRDGLARADRVVVVGAGFIGSEVASAARLRGLPVDVVEPQPVPMAHLFGPEVGAELARLHELNGVTVHAGVGVAELVGVDAVSGVRLTDGRMLPADMVVIGIGATPATEWLSSSGLPVGDGVTCDERLRVVGAHRVYAAGDVARWPSVFATEPIRIEHWTNANEHGAMVAASIVGVDPPRPQPPYVWSDQYGSRIQIVGSPRAGRPARVVGTASEGTLTALFADPGGRCVGALVLNDARSFMKCRRAITARSLVDDLDIGVAVAT